MFFLRVPFFSFLSFLNSKFINCSKRFVLKCKIQTVRDRVFRSLRFVDAILILLTQDAKGFKSIAYSLFSVVPKFSELCTPLNPLNPNFIRQILFTGLHRFYWLLIGRTFSNITTIRLWWSVAKFSWPVCVTIHWFDEEKFDADRCWAI